MADTVKLQGWPLGVIGRYSNHLAWPENALSDGSNIELSNGGLRTRDGYLFHADQTHSSHPLPVGTVKVLQQIRFPTRQVTYLVAQVDTGTTNKLYYCTDNLLTTGAGEWMELFNLGAGAGTVSIAVLGDRAVFTEGINHPPLVWGGSVETDGSDWQTPKQVVLSWDDLNFHDATAAMTDPDATTTEGIGGLGADDGEGGYKGSIYICCDQAKVSGLYLNMGTVTTDCAPDFFYWDGDSWEELTVTDGTAGLTQDGVVSWTEVTIANSLIADIPGFWIKISPQALVATSATISEIRFQASCQNLAVIGDGLPDIPMACMWRDDSTGAVHEIAADVSDYTPATYQLLNDGNPDTSLAEAFTDSDWWYIGYPLQFNGIEIEVNGNFPNEATATLSGQYWDGDGWSYIGEMVDTTSESGVTLNHKGKLTWTMPSDWKMCRPLSAQYPLGYYVRLGFLVLS